MAQPPTVICSGQEATNVVIESNLGTNGTGSLDIAPKQLAKILSFDSSAADLCGHMVHSIDVHSVDSESAVGVEFASGDARLGGAHSTHVHVSPSGIKGYHAVGSGGGKTTFDPPIRVHVGEYSCEEIPGLTAQLAKRSSRWKDHVGDTAQDLMKGLIVESGSVDGKLVERVLVPIAGEHPITRALDLNAGAGGHLDQYSPANRKTVTLPGTGEHVIMEKPHVDAIASTLADNLRVKSQLGMNGLKMRVTSIDPSGKRGKVRVHAVVHKYGAANAMNGAVEFKPPIVPLTTANAVDAAVGSEPAPSVAEITSLVLSAKLKSAAPGKGIVVPNVAVPVPGAATTVPSATLGDG